MAACSCHLLPSAAFRHVASQFSTVETFISASSLQDQMEFRCWRSSIYLHYHFNEKMSPFAPRHDRNLSRGKVVRVTPSRAGPKVECGWKAKPLVVVPRSIIHLSSLTDVIPGASSEWTSKTVIKLKRKSQPGAETRFGVLDSAASERSLPVVIDRWRLPTCLWPRPGRLVSRLAGNIPHVRTSYLRHFSLISFCRAPRLPLAKVGPRCVLSRIESSLPHGVLRPAGTGKASDALSHSYLSFHICFLSSFFTYPLFLLIIKWIAKLCTPSFQPQQ